MKSRAMTRRRFLQVFLVSTLWLTALTTSAASSTAPDVSAGETLTFEQGENKMGQVFQATGAPAAEHEIQTANPNASNDAKKVLSYIASLPDRQDNRVISGQHIGGGWYDTEYGIITLRSYQEHVVALHDLTGKWPGMLGAGYGSGMHDQPEYGWPKAKKISTVNQLLIDHWNSGGLVSVDHIADNPWTGGDAWDLSHKNLEELLNPTTDFNRQAHQRWMDELDKVAAGLAELRDAGVVVLWRPFPELTYLDCYWWNAGEWEYWNDPNWSPEPFIDMWKHMFNYFTYEKGLNNLLWVYNAADTEPWIPLDKFYPGNDFIDIVTTDVYRDQTIIQGDGYNRLLAIGKPFALHEAGPGTQLDGSFDNMNIINAIKSRYPKTTYFHTWQSWPGNKCAMVDNQNAGALLNDPWVITRDELDWRSDPDEIIMDNTDARFSTSYSQDAWQEYTEVGGQHYGSSHHYNEQAGTGQDIGTWSFSVPRPGNYDVYAWWWGGEWRPSDVSYIINHSNGSTTVRVDQRVNGGQWNHLGEFYFEDEGSVVVSDDASSGYGIVADAIRLVYQVRVFLPFVTR